MIKNTDTQGEVWLLPPWSWSTSPSQYVDMITNLEALPTPCYWDFYGGFLTQGINY